MTSIQQLWELPKVVKYEDQWWLFLLEIKIAREVVEGQQTATQAHQQGTITTSFSLIYPTHASSQSRTAQMGSRPGHCIRVTVDW